MFKFIAGLLIGLLLIPIGVFCYFRSGRAPVASAASMIPFEQRLAKMALHARVDKEMPTTVPIAADEANLTAGAKTYHEHCAFCHGTPGQTPSAAAQGMFPKPPQLFVRKGVTDDPAGETYWKVANGIRLTGMPSYSKTLSDTQMWQVSLVLLHAHDLPPSAMNELKVQPAAGK